MRRRLPPRDLSPRSTPSRFSSPRRTSAWGTWCRPTTSSGRSGRPPRRARTSSARATGLTPIQQLAGSIARTPLVAGEPVREAKLIKADGSGFMAAILPSGMRAVSTEISPETGAGGFILPNDHVDVILTPPRPRSGEAGRRRRPHQRDHPAATSACWRSTRPSRRRTASASWSARPPRSKLTPRQAETLALSRQLGTLSLALRSIVDANAPAATDGRRPAEQPPRHQHGPLRRDHDDHAEMRTGAMASKLTFRAAPLLATLIALASAAASAPPSPAEPLPRRAADHRAATATHAFRAARRRQVGGDRSAARRQGRAGRQSADRQRGRALGAARLPDRRRGRPDQRVLLRRRGPSDRRLRHRGDPRPQRRAGRVEAGPAARRRQDRGRRRRRHADRQRRQSRRIAAGLRYRRRVSSATARSSTA